VALRSANGAEDFIDVCDGFDQQIGPTADVADHVDAVSAGVEAAIARELAAVVSFAKFAHGTVLGGK
jgi:hypothetical protein